MATKTPKYGLNKPAQEDFYNVDVQNENMDKIEAALTEKVDNEAGKGLSQNDYTTADKNKVNNLPENTNEELGKKVDATTLKSHTVNENIHVSSKEKETWNGKIDKVASSKTGNIPKLKSDGSLEDSGKSLDDFADKEHETVSVVGENGVHDIRYFKRKLEVFEDGEWKQAGSGVGVEAHITAPAGSVVTATDGITAITETATDGILIMALPNYGTWVISANLGGKTTNTVSLNCTVSKIYPVTLSLFSVTVEVTALEGSIVTLQKGDWVQTATSTGTVSFNVYEAGTYSVYATYEGVNSNTANVIVTTSGATLNVAVDFITLDVTCDAGSTVVVARGGYAYSKVSEGTTRFYLPETGVWSVTASLSTDTTTESITISAYTNHAIEMIYYKVYGVTIDMENSNPETSVTYTDDAIGMVGGSRDWDSMPIFKDIKPCLLLNGVVRKYLNPNNFAQDIDGNAVDIESGAEGDVMIEIPKIAYKLVNSGTTITVQITNNPIKTFDGFRYYAHTRQTEGDCDKLYVGAYLGAVTDSKLRSLSDSTPTMSSSSLGLTDFRTLARANGEGYDMLSFYPLSLLQCLYLIRYKNLNSQAALGMGYVGGSAHVKTGATNQKSMYYGTTDNLTQMKFAGIEDFYGNATYFIDGIASSAIALPTAEFSHLFVAFDEFNNNLDGYKDYGVLPASESSMYIKKVQGTTEIPFLVAKVGGGGSATTYYCDYISMYESSVADFGGNCNDGTKAGVFCLNLNSEPTASGIGGRLMCLKASD